MGGSILLRISFFCFISTLSSEAYRVVESENETSTPFEPYEKGFVGKVSIYLISNTFYNQSSQSFTYGTMSFFLTKTWYYLRVQNSTIIIQKHDPDIPKRTVTSQGFQDGDPAYLQHHVGKNRQQVRTCTCLNIHYCYLLTWILHYIYTNVDVRSFSANLHLL